MRISAEDPKAKPFLVERTEAVGRTAASAGGGEAG
jgi:hypothetical protein